MLNADFIKKMEERLKSEEAQLELELTDIGKLHNSAGDWSAHSGSLQTGTEDKNVLADKMEEILTNESIADELEVRLANVKAALERIKNESYGICEKCDSQISEDRLEANPAATLCITCAEE